MEFPPKLRWLGVLASVVWIGFNAPGIIQNWQAWKTAGPTIRFVLPVRTALWVIPLAILVLWGPTWWHMIQAHRKRLGRAGHADSLERQQIALEAQVVDLKQQVADKENTCEVLRGMINDARKERDEAQAGLDRYKDMTWQLDSILNYGEEFPKYGDLPGAELQDVVSKVWDVYGPWLSAFDASRKLWDAIGKTATAAEKSLASQLWARIEQREHARAERALAKLKEALEQKWDPRKYLARLFTCYMDWRALMRPLSMRLPEKVLDVEGRYANVKEAEKRLWIALKERLELPALRVVKLTIESYEREHVLFDDDSWPDS